MLVTRAQVDWKDLLCNSKLVATVYNFTTTNTLHIRSIWWEREGFVVDTFPGVKVLGLVVGSRRVDEGDIVQWGGRGQVGAKQNEENLRRKVEAHSGGIVKIVQESSSRSES